VVARTDIRQRVEPNRKINEGNCLSREFSDDFVHAQAGAGDFLLDEEGYQYRQFSSKTLLERFSFSIFPPGNSTTQQVSHHKIDELTNAVVSPYDRRGHDSFASFH
jgi:hypothetical protein